MPLSSCRSVGAASTPVTSGLLVAFVMNLVHLAPGESAFTPDGQVHAYVSGTAIELMNPSDNVMRAGLTAKHIDTEELIKVLGESQDAPVIQRPTPDERTCAWHHTPCGMSA